MNCCGVVLTLSRDDTTLTESIVEKLEVRLLEQARSRALGVGGVCDDDIKAVLVVIQELETVTNVHLNLGVLVARSHIREVDLGETNDSLISTISHKGSISHLMVLRAYLINVTEGGLLNAVMLDHLTEHTSVTTTNDQDLLRVGVREHGKVGNHLLVRELVVLGALDDVVKNQHVAVLLGLEDQDILVLALLVVQDLLDLQSHGLACRPNQSHQSWY